MARFRAFETDSEGDDDVLPMNEKQADDASEESMDSVEEAIAPRNPRGLVIESDEDEEEDSEYYTEGSEHGEDNESSTSDSPSPLDRKGGDSSIIPWARKVGVEPQRIHVMQSAFFRAPEEAAVMKEVLQPIPQRRLLEQRPLSRKHSRDSEGDGLRGDSRQRASFAHAVETTPYRPSRKYARVESAASAVNGQEKTFADAGLALGRSFRVGWGHGAQLAHLGGFCAPFKPSPMTANSSLITLSTVPTSSASTTRASERSSKLLSHHLTNSPITTDDHGIPFATPSADLTFASFAALFSSNDKAFEASLFRLGQALFDPIQLNLSDKIHPDIRTPVTNLRRKVALSNWLQSTVAPAVDADIRGNVSVDWASTVFALLTGKQVQKASETAIDTGNVKLATLISQAPGDEDFRADLQMQLTIWKEQRIDTHIDETVRKIYALLAGVVDTLEGSKAGVEQCADVDLQSGLDWKRIFGLYLWYGQPMDATVSDVFDAYRNLSENKSLGAASPMPWYMQQSEETQSMWKLLRSTEPPDALYSLIRLYSDPTCSLSDILSPLSFDASPVDYRLPWHLYVILSRCLRVRDLADRGDPGVIPDSQTADVDEPPVEGHSPTADLLANSYAMQLEELGMIQEAVFVLLHLEGSAGRKRAVKELLCRSASKLDDWTVRGLVGSLKLPLSWINEAKATLALDRNDIYSAYKLYLSAGLYDTAHDLAVLYLAPEAVIMQDLNLMEELFEKFAGHAVNGWHVRGKAYLDYAHAMKRIPELRDYRDERQLLPDAAQKSESKTSVGP